MGFLLKSVVVLILAWSGHRIFQIYKFGGGFCHHHQHHPGPCKQMEGIQLGSEDFHTLSNGLTFISSGLRYSQLSPQSLDHFRRHKIRGRIYLLDLRNLIRGVQELTIASTPAFHTDTFAPHGLSVWEDHQTGRHVLFVVNHRVQSGPFDSRVEKFVYEPDRQELVHLATLSDPAMTVVNDVAATGQDSFYFTNCNFFPTVLGAVVETFLEMPLSSLVHYDGYFYTLVASDLMGASGVALSPDSKIVYVADRTAQEVLVYRRKPDNRLILAQAYPVYTGPDNVQVDQSTGHLYIACHPLLFQFLIYVVDLASEHAPSQVLHLQVQKGKISSSQEVMYDHGQLISGSSSALVFEGTLLIGSVFDRFVTCDVHVPLLQ